MNFVKTAFDIVICTILIRFLLGWILANRRLVRLALALLALSAFVVLVNKTALPLAQWLATTISLPLAILLISVFLPDVRNAYYSTSIEFLGFVKRPVHTDVIHIIAESLLELSHHRWGALLVFVRADPVHQTITSGEEYDAKVTKSLLLSLFNPTSPRHDGAVIISGDRIVRAGAILPLTTTDITREDWGTRHRAAHGITESSDAAVAVVSEQRGSVSLGYNGSFHEISDPTIAGLSNELPMYITSQAAPARRRITGLHSLVLWIVALAISAIASLSIAFFNPVPEQLKTKLTIIQVPIQYENIPDKLFLEESDPHQCFIYLRIPQGTTPVVNHDTIIAINLADHPAGEEEIPLTEQMLQGLQTDWDVERCVPDHVRIILAAARQLPLQIEPQFTALSTQLVVVSSVVTPSNMLFLVKDAQIKETSPVKTRYINLSRIHQPGGYRFASFLDMPVTIRAADGVRNPQVTIDISITALITNHLLQGILLDH